MRTNMQDCTVVEVRAMHDFSAIVARRVFTGADHRTRACTWAVLRCEEEKAKADEADPSCADIHRFEADHRILPCEVGLGD